MYCLCASGGRNPGLFIYLFITLFWGALLSPLFPLSYEASFQKACEVSKITILLCKNQEKKKKQGLQEWRKEWC